MTRRSAPLIPALLALLAVSAALVTLRRCTDRGEPELPAAPAATDAEDRSTGATETIASTRAAARLGAQLLGRVVDDQGEPIGGALVTLVQSGRENAQVTARQVTARTDASGAYELRGLPTGPLGVRAAAAGHATMQIGDLRPDRAPDQRLVVRALQLPRAVRYHGRVSCEGRGLADVEVRVLPQLAPGDAAAPLVRSTRTDEQGRFEVLEAPPPPVHVAVDTPDHRALPAGSQLVGDAAAPVLFTCERWPTLVGAVVDRASSAPIRGARLNLRGLDATGSDTSRVDAENEADGAFAMPMREGETFVLGVRAAGYAEQLLELSPDAHRAPLQVALTAAGSITGVVTRGGDPCAASLTLHRRVDDLAVASAPTAEAGVYSLTGILPGSYVLRVDPANGARQDRRVELTAGEPLTLDVTVTDGASWTGRVTGALPLPAEVCCRLADGLARRGAVRADGTFVVEGLSQGDWSLTAYSKRRTWADKAARMLLERLPFRAELSVSETAARDGSAIYRDVAAPGSRLGSLRGQLSPQQAGAAFEIGPLDADIPPVPPGLLRGTVGSDGTLRLDAVLPGRWRVTLRSAGGSRTAEVTVVAGRAAFCDEDAFGSGGR